MLQDVMNAGAVGAEIVLSGRIPSARARSWRFSAGYLKKSGDIAVSKVKHSKVSVNLTIGTVGVKVSIMTPDIELPDKLLLAADKTVKVEEVKQPEQQVAVEEQKVEAVSEVKTEEKPKAKRAPRKKKEEKQENHGDNPKE
jgi:small subunit ribosomal protein S3